MMISSMNKLLSLFQFDGALILFFVAELSPALIESRDEIQAPYHQNENGNKYVTGTASPTASSSLLFILKFQAFGHIFISLF